MKNQRYILTSGLLLASLAFFGGCSKEDSINSSERYLNFGVNTVDMSITRSSAAEATESATSVTLKTQGGNVYLPMTVTEEPNCDFAAAGTKAESISDITSFYTKGFDDNGDQWFPASGNPELVTTGKQYSGYRWLEDNEYFFLAYSDLPDYASATIADKDMTLTISSIPSDAEAQQDILLGVYEGDGNGEGKAAMNFYHPLSAVIFKLGSTSGTMSITGISIDGVKKGGSTVWSYASESGGLLKFDWSNASGSIKVEQQILSPAPGGQLGVPFMLIPQTLTSENSATITVTATVDEVAKEFTASLTSGEWVSGMKYTYTLNFATGPDPDFWVDLGMVSENGYPLYVSRRNVARVEDGTAYFTDNEYELGTEFLYWSLPDIVCSEDGQDCRVLNFAEMWAISKLGNASVSFDDSRNCILTSTLNSNKLIFPVRNTGIAQYKCVHPIVDLSQFEIDNESARFLMGDPTVTQDVNVLLKLIYEDRTATMHPYKDNTYKLFVVRRLSGSSEQNLRQLILNGAENIEYNLMSLVILTEIERENGYKGLYQDVPYGFEFDLIEGKDDYELKGTVLTSSKSYPGQAKVNVIFNNHTDFFYWKSIPCFAKGTMISLADGSKKKVEDLTYEDELLVWNFDKACVDKAKILWINNGGQKTQYYWRCELSDGTILKLVGPFGHRLFNYDSKKFEYPTDIKPGTRIFTENGVVRLDSCMKVEESVDVYNLITDYHINCYANGVLTSCRYNRIYPIDQNMRFIKDGRKKRPYSEFKEAGISREWYNGLRLGEQTDSLDNIKAYIVNRNRIEQPKPAPTLWQRFKTWFKSVFGCNS